MEECPGAVCSSDGRMRGWRRSGELFPEYVLSPRPSHKGDSVMVWEEMSMNASAELVFIEAQ